MTDDLEPNWFQPSKFPAPPPRTELPPEPKDHPRTEPDFLCSPIQHSVAADVIEFYTPFVLVILLAAGGFSWLVFGWPPIPSFFN